VPVPTTIVDLRHRSGLVQLEMSAFRLLFGEGFGHALDIDGGAGVARAFGDRLGHRFDMAVARIIQDENFGHLNLHELRC